MKKIFLLVTLCWMLAAGTGLTAVDAAKDNAPDHPKIVKKVNPVYPEEALKKGIEGVVRIEASSDEKGDVVAAKVLPGKNPQPLLEAAALAAVRQWKYEPFLVNGKAVGVTFTVTLNFSMQKDKQAERPTQASPDHPKIVKKVNPVYPEEAVKKRIEGVVRIGAAIDEKGDVVKANVLPAEKPQPLLEAAALAAVRQWKYEPFLVNGKATGVTFTVTMNFALDKDGKKEK
jgi:TonB family protein